MTRAAGSDILAALIRTAETTMLRKVGWMAGAVVALVVQVAMADGLNPKIEEIRSQQAEIRAGVNAGTGRYRGMTLEQKQALLRKQDHVLAVLDGKQSMSDLDASESIGVFNDLEWIEAAINKTEDERVTCTRERATGSNRVVRVCRTEAQIRAARERARLQKNEGKSF